MAELTRRQTIAGAAMLGLTGTAIAQDAPALDPDLAPDPEALARIIREFLRGATVQQTGIDLVQPPIGDNPAQVSVAVRVTEALPDGIWCDELVVLAERNPYPLACRFRFTQEMGLADVALRLRLTQSQTVSAYARLTDGRFLVARSEITVTTGGCGI